MSKRLYVGGPMRGLPEFGFPAFDKAAKLLSEAGFDPINPADHDRANGFDAKGMTGNEDLAALGFSLPDALTWDLQQVAAADGVAVLPGWANSSGARAEVATAHALGVPVATVEQWLRVEPRAYITPLTPRSDNAKPPVQIVGLNGFARSGKDTVADQLVERHGFTKLSMAGPLKTMLRTLDPTLMNTEAGVATRLSGLHRMTEDELKASVYGAEYRRLLQVLGTDCIRAIDPDFWVKAMDKAVRGAERVVIPDVRFPNEAEWVRSQGGIVIEILRPGVGPANGHASENRLERHLVDCTVHNNGTVEDLHRKLRTIVSIVELDAA